MRQITRFILEFFFKKFLVQDMSGEKRSLLASFSIPAQLKFSILAVERRGRVRPFWKLEQFCSSDKLKWPGISFGKAEQCRLKDGW